MRTLLRNLNELLRLLTTPVLYLHIVNSRKHRIDRWVPWITVVLVVPPLALVGGLNIFAEYGLVYGVNGLLQILSGFFITALAAIATFPGSPAYPVDVTLTGEGATIQHGEDDIEQVTRRRFLCLLFGYLAMVSLFLYLVGVLVMMLAPALHNVAAAQYPWLRLMTRGLFIGLYVPVLAHMLASTMLGLVFLADRIPSGAGSNKPMRFKARKTPDAFAVVPQDTNVKPVIH